MVSRQESRPYTVAGGGGCNQEVPFCMGWNGSCSVRLLWISCGKLGLWTTAVDGEKPGDPGRLSACCNVKEKNTFCVCVKETRRGKCHWWLFLGSHLSYPYVTLQNIERTSLFLIFLNAKTWSFLIYIFQLFKLGPWLQTSLYSAWKFSRSWAVHLKPYLPRSQGKS